MARVGLREIFRMWQFVGMGSIVLVMVTDIAAQKEKLVHLQMSRVERGLRSTNGVVSTIKLHLVSACILHGTSLENCHAVNYSVSNGLWEVISTHGSLLEIKTDVNYIFVALKNTYDLLHTGVQSDCSQGPVQWKEQATNYYMALENVVYSDSSTPTNFICKATVGENELPGVKDNQRHCYFVYNDLIGYTGLYRTLVLKPDSGLSVTWMNFSIGDDVPQGAFVGGHLSPATPLYVCRAARERGPICWLL